MVFAFWISSPLSTIFVLIRIFISPRANFSMVSSNCFEYCYTINTVKYVECQNIIICQLSTSNEAYINLWDKDNQFLDLVNPNSQIFIMWIDYVRDAWKPSKDLKDIYHGSGSMCHTTQLDFKKHYLLALNKRRKLVKKISPYRQ